LILLLFDILLISLDLLILSVIFIFLTLELVTKERTGAQSYTATNRRSKGGMANGSADQSACRSTTECANAGTFFSSR
jgi:hypothetical protein